jgi:hypothetical protein
LRLAGLKLPGACPTLADDLIEPARRPLPSTPVTF